MIDVTAFEDAIRSWAFTVLGVEVIFANQAEPRPDTPYVTINVNSVQTVGRDYEVGPDSSDNVEVKGLRVFVVEFQALGANALGLLDSLKTSLDKVSTTELLDADDISILNSNNIIDITIKLETKYEKRGEFEVRFAVGSSEIDSIDVIETINIDYTVDNPDGSNVLDDTINI